MLDNYNSGITLSKRAEVQNRAKAVDGICGTITAIEILYHFGIELSDEDIKNGIMDCAEGTNQVNMALFMSNYLDVTYCVNYDVKTEIENGPSSTLSESNHKEFSKLLNNESINFAITPNLEDIIKILNEENALAQFVFLETGASMTHYGLLCNVENDLLEFTQRDNQSGKPDVTIEDFHSWWDLQGQSNKDPAQLVLIYRQKNIR